MLLLKMFHYLNRSEFKLCWVVVVLVCFSVNLVGAEMSDDLLPVLYLKYKEAFNDGKWQRRHEYLPSESTISVRRLFNGNKQYEIHVKKLKEVNGFKVHNLLVKETVRSNENPLIYINNPVESDLPNTYLTLEEFKSVLTKRIKAQKDEFTAKRKSVTITDILKKSSKKVINKKATTRYLLRTSIKKIKKNSLNTVSTVKEKPVKGTRKLLSKELKPKLTTQQQFSKQNTVSKKIRSTLENKSPIKTLRDIKLKPPQSFKKEELKPKLTSKNLFSKQNTLAKKIQGTPENIISIQTLKDTKHKSTQSLIRKELKPKVTTKQEFSIQNTLAKKMDDTSGNKSSIQTLKDTKLPQQTTSEFTEKTITSLTTEPNKKYSEIAKVLNITDNERSTQTLKGTIIVKSELNATISTVSDHDINNITNLTEAKEITKGINNTVMKETKEINIKSIDINETTAYSMDTINTVSMNTLTALLNVTTTSSEVTSTTETTLNTEEEKRPPKRSTPYKKLTQKRGFDTKSTKRKRSTLGRPMVFME